MTPRLFATPVSPHPEAVPTGAVDFTSDSEIQCHFNDSYTSGTVSEPLLEAPSGGAVAGNRFAPGVAATMAAADAPRPGLAHADASLAHFSRGPEAVAAGAHAAFEAQLMGRGAALAAGVELPHLAYFGPNGLLFSAANNFHQRERLRAFLRENPSSAALAARLIVPSSVLRYWACEDWEFVRRGLEKEWPEQDPDQVALLVRLYRVEEALAACDEFGVDAYVLESGIVVLSDGSFGVFERHGDGLLFRRCRPDASFKLDRIFTNNETSPDFLASLGKANGLATGTWRDFSGASHAFCTGMSGQVLAYAVADRIFVRGPEGCDPLYAVRDVSAGLKPIAFSDSLKWFFRDGTFHLGHKIVVAGRAAYFAKDIGIIFYEDGVWAAPDPEIPFSVAVKAGAAGLIWRGRIFIRRNDHFYHEDDAKFALQEARDGAGLALIPVAKDAALLEIGGSPFVCDEKARKLIPLADPEAETLLEAALFLVGRGEGWTVEIPAEMEAAPKNVFKHGGGSWRIRHFLPGENGGIFVTAWPLLENGETGRRLRLFVRGGDGAFSPAPEGVHRIRGTDGSFKEYFFRNGRLWDLSRLGEGLHVLHREGLDETADPRNLFAFVRDASGVRPATSAEMAGELVKILSLFSAKSAGVSGTDEITPRQTRRWRRDVPALVAEASPQAVLETFYPGKTGRDGETVMMEELSVRDGGTEYVYRYPSAADPSAAWARENGHHVPDKDDVLAFHDRMRRTLPAFASRTVRRITFFAKPAKGRSRSNGRETRVGATYRASDDALVFYAGQPGDRRTWLDRVCGRLLTHEVCGHGAERGDETLKRCVQLALLLDGAFTEYGETHWREYFAVLAEYYFHAPDYRHQFRWGFLVLDAAFASRDGLIA